MSTGSPAAIRSICVSLKFATTYVLRRHDHHERHAGLHHLAVVRAELRDVAGDRRGDLRVAELELREIERGLRARRRARGRASRRRSPLRSGDRPASICSTWPSRLGDARLRLRLLHRARPARFAFAASSDACAESRAACADSSAWPLTAPASCSFFARSRSCSAFASPPSRARPWPARLRPAPAPSAPRRRCPAAAPCADDSAPPDVDFTMSTCASAASACARAASRSASAAATFAL